MDSKLVMYIFVNSDLKMTAGKIASQVGHVVQSIIDKIVNDTYQIIPVPDYCMNYMMWKEMPTKIILKGTTEQLENIKNTALNSAFIIDDGQTQVEPDSLTVVGLFPDIVTNKYDDFKLL